MEKNIKKKKRIFIYVKLNHFIAQQNEHNMVDQLYFNKKLKNKNKSIKM